MLNFFWYFENFVGAQYFQEHYNGSKKNSFMPKHFGHSEKILTLKKESGSLGICMLSDHFRQFIGVKKSFVSAHHSRCALT